MKTLLSLLLTISLCSSSVASAQNNVVFARATMQATGTPASQENPPCTAATQSKNIGQSIVDAGIDVVGKASSSLGLGPDPFNTRRLNQSMCMDLCVVIPQGSSFTAKGSVAGEHPWQGDLPAGLPATIKPGNWWAIEGPSVTSTGQGDVVCYTSKNWSHNLERKVGIEVKY